MSTNEDLGELDSDELADGDITEIDELDGYRDLGDDLEEDAEDDDEDVDADKPEAPIEDEPAADDLDEEDDQDEEESLEALLGTDETTSTETSPRVAGAKAPEGIGEDEFTCRVCFLVKSRAQLADTDEIICADCA